MRSSASYKAEYSLSNDVSGCVSKVKINLQDTIERSGRTISTRLINIAFDSCLSQTYNGVRFEARIASIYTRQTNG